MTLHNSNRQTYSKTNEKQKLKLENFKIFE